MCKLYPLDVGDIVCRRDIFQQCCTHTQCLVVVVDLVVVVFLLLRIAFVCVQQQQPHKIEQTRLETLLAFSFDKCWGNPGI